MINKKIIYLIVAIIILSLGVWFFFFRTTTPTPSSPTNSGLPFGSGGPDVTTAGQTTKAPSTGLDTSGRPLSKLFQISDTPVAGAVAILKNGSTVIRYTDRATGHIYDVNPETMEKIKISNNTLPKIYEAYYKKDGSGVMYRSLKDGEDVITNTSISLNSPKSTSTGSVLYTLNASMLRGDIGELAVLPTGNIVYSTNNPGSIVTSSFSGEKPINLYSTPFTEWRISPSGQSEVYITTKAGGGADGYSYKLNTKTGAISKILGPLTSLTTLASQNGKYLSYSYSSNNKTVSVIQNLSNKIIVNLLPTTLVEKCVWSAKKESEIFCGAPTDGLNDNEPDLWYKGQTHYSDRLWVLDANTEAAVVLAQPKKDLGVDIDVENPSLSPDEDYLIFINKSDLSLWALNLK